MCVLNTQSGAKVSMLPGAFHCSCNFSKCLYVQEKMDDCFLLAASFSMMYLSLHCNQSSSTILKKMPLTINSVTFSPEPKDTLKNHKNYGGMETLCLDCINGCVC